MSDGAYSPQEIAQRVESVGLTKARLDALTTLVLATLAGAFIALGAVFYTVVVTDSGLGFGATRMLGGVAFSLGLILVVVGGAELFTGNNLVAMAWASSHVTTGQLARNWSLVYAGNMAGALGTVGLVTLAGTHELHDGAVGETVKRIAMAKIGLEPLRAVTLGILCNTLVCLAVWLSIGGRSVTDKAIAIVFPITAFVACGFEHSIANWFFLPWAWAIEFHALAGFKASACANLLAVTVGNVLGGGLLVAGVYWLAYLRPARRG